MKKNLLLLCLFCIFINKATAQSSVPYGKTVIFSLKDFNAINQKSPKVNGLASKMTLKFPLPSGKLEDFVFDETLISPQKITNIQTFDAISSDGKINLKLTIMGDKVEGIMHTPDGYFFIEPIDAKTDTYRIYGINELPQNSYDIRCGVKDEDLQPQRNGRILSIAPFPVGTQLRKYKLAAAATGEMTGFYGSQANALAKIVSITNATNLIYELEASMTFELATQTANLSIIFSNPATDPFGTIAPTNCQASFTAMNTSGVLPYTDYGIGHTFNTLASLGGGSYSSNGVAGPTPCVDASKSRAFTQWTYDAPVSLIVSVFAHEVGHQFSAPHTYNAIGGTAGSPTFCIDGWSSTSAIEPGSGSTLMSYKNNCVNPTNYTLSGSNGLQYFNTKTLEFIFNAVNGSSGTCITSTATGNSAPVANAGADVTIPKGTPFTLNGTATDANGDAMTYTWEQYDVALANDKGALGSSINGAGGYSAVNSTTAPLFRSEQSSSTTLRTFPKLNYILHNANNPADNEGEDLPQVARSMNFRFTVRDNKTGGGGVDSDAMVVTVDNSGPFALISQNTATLWIYNGTNTADITWSVNGTNAAPLSVANVKISLSTDGGTTFPTVLVASTPNDGTHTITIPNNISSQVRLKIEPVGTYAFFDINDVNITITNTCSPETTSVTPTATLTAPAGDVALNLGLSSYGSSISSFTGTISTTSSTSNLSFESPTGTCSGPSNSNYYAVHMFQVISTGTYTFTRTAGSGLVMNLYSAAYNTSSVCSNWIGSSGKQSTAGGPVSVSTTLSKSLTPGIYYLVISSFSTSSPVLPVNYTITPSVSTIYNPAPAAGSPYAYTYLVKNNTTGNITGFADNSNLTNSTTYPAGAYTVYGFSYQGGLNLASYVGTSFTTFQGLLTANTVCGKLSTNSMSVTINPCSAPAAPTATGGSRCGTGTVSLSATGCAGTYNWYASSTSSASLGTTAAYTTPSISTTTTYYVDCTVSGCTSTSRSSAIATITPLPLAPTATGGSRCGTGTVSLSATGCAGTYNWYTASTSGSSFGTGSSFTTPSISTTTTYYVDCTVSGCTSASRSSAIATVNTAPSVPTVSGGGSCLNSPVMLTATGCAGTYNWYTALTGGALLTTGASLTGLTSSGTYYVDCTVGTCVSSRASGTITVKPAAPTVAGVTILTGQTATLTATGCSGTVKWYASTTGTAVLLTATSYTTPTLTVNTTYYADCTVSSCTSATRTAATVTISTCPSTLTLVSTADDIASGNITKQASATVSAAPNANIMATNKVTGVGTRATYQAKSILLNPGFKADSGTIFKAEIGGCN